MFSIFDASSFTNINRKPAPLETPKNAPNTFTSSARTKATTSDATSSIQGTKLSGFQQRQIKTHNIVGTRFRSKTGCLNCRRRKKKCDETSPVCQACQVRNQECVWPDLSKGSNTKRISKPSGAVPTKRIVVAPAPSSFTIDLGMSSSENKSFTTTPSTATNLSNSTKSSTPATTASSSLSSLTDSRVNGDRSSVPPYSASWKYDTTLLAFDPALVSTTLPVSSTRNDTLLGSTDRQIHSSSLHSSASSSVSVQTGMVDFDNEHEEAMDDVGHLNMNVLLT
ncbi:Fungal Zn(2)-Cys(6) binuclear cluster domain family protein [Candida parapsilosis]|uniref:Fungal Zn(2)-Cys(6) binuclear cluster domain family protein n=1 Tax=Candida parapsilosis TaxID=5480 RepID=A0A8X7T8F9_CANPA|nr:Fungal Zn(2)-Cys(6) binuclear cluster domain family protein [Candida parapsilosis]KAF6047796.1 Fungal Zn(2)-Cys(6) binuclear cluster domain family protein [Candida parapsilosis]KAF6050236.1 Fungal Zn(2)-Cys(6) binuclear cluster domain family protein [Candida parapsilosis]KAF6061356.1 Fungal Zn(2)-Cys(6) binuclear cluster domain family protein [Candida parapsilosis]KAI5904240.1 Transcriptional regulatory protein moc3 [Candida parapsilosis]